MTKLACRVCNKLYDGATHCSVNACKACAMFFKRSTNWSSNPICRTGRNDCRIDRAGSIACPSCRYRKCIEAGMKPKRNRIRRKCIENLQDRNNNHVNNMKMTIELPELIIDDMPTLKRFAYFYARSANNRKANEFALLHADGANLYELPGNRIAGRFTQSLSNRMMPYDICEFINVLNDTFPAFTTLENRFQDNLVHLLAFPLFELAASFRSLRVFNDVNCKKILCSEALYADLEDLAEFLEPNMFENPADYKAIKEYVGGWWGKYLNKTLQTMHRIKITDEEFLAVYALTIWDEDNFCHIPQLSMMAEKHRSLIYKDLDYYYRNILQMENYVERVMNFKELGSIMKSNYAILSESFHFLRSFNYYNSTEGLWETSSKVISALESIQQ